MPIDFKNVVQFFKDRHRVIAQGLAVGGTIVVGGIVARKFMLKGAAPPDFEQLTESGNAVLGADGNATALCTRLQPYRCVDAVAHDTVITRIAELVHLTTQMQQEEVRLKISMPRKASRIASQIVESVRVLRAKLKRSVSNNSRTMQDFDDVAGDLQAACNDYNYNISQYVGLHL
jgi:hypothetical protein